MSRQFPTVQFNRAARSLGIAALCLALSAPLSAQEPRPRAIFVGHVEAVESVFFSQDGKTLASACSDCSIRLWDVASGRNTATLREEGPGAKKLPYLWATVAFSPDGKKRRAAALAGIATMAGKQRDEYPPAMFREGGAGADVRLIDSRDNEASGASMGNQLRKFDEGDKILLRVVP